MSVKPRFGGGGEKCKTCEQTVYPNERISYDNGTWHQLCFKCLSCRSTLSLTAVAMINGDLYCKTCFKKTFLREGKYSTFQSLPREVGAQLTHTASMASEGRDRQPSSPSVPVRSASVSVTGRSASSSVTVRSPSTSVTSTAASAAPTTPQTPVAQLQAAIERKDVTHCQTLLTSHGAGLLFEHVKSGVTLLEWSLTSYMHKATGVRLVDWLQAKVEETNRLVKQNGLVSPLEGSDSQQRASEVQVEESKESTEAETEPADAANEVEVTA